MKRMGVLVAVWVGMVCGRCPGSAAQEGYLYGLHPGKAGATVEGDHIVVKNAEMTARWTTTGGKLSSGAFGPPMIVDRQILPGEVFELVLSDGGTLKASSLEITEPANVQDLQANPDAARLEEHFAGKRVSVRLEDSKTQLGVVWSAEMRDGDNYVRQTVSLTAAGKDVAIREVRLWDFFEPFAKVSGTVKGSPVVVRDYFLGFEHPLSQCTTENHQVRCSIQRELPLKAGQTILYSSVIGVSPAGQMRRGFLNYVERERAHPYRPFLHYNSWFDIGFGQRYDEASAVDAIDAFGEELHAKRGVKLDSFLFDDGWDDPKSLWSFDPGFPDGFTRVKAEAEKYGAEPGIWLSPWGGYDQAKEQRMKYGKAQGFEMNEKGFALSGPKYFQRFKEVTLEFIGKYGVNQFKIDGTGNVNSVFPGSGFDSDFHAAIGLIEDWRKVKPDIFVNLTTGTYPSPFWLEYADSIWRGGEDTSFAGVGPWREKWITYRDGDTYAGIVRKGPLFPLNSLMLHGIVFAKQAEHLNSDPRHAFTHEVHSYFGTGTQLQELYITHAILTDEEWDVLAEAAKWSRENQETLADTHWIGGNPKKLQIYGWAAWSPKKGILTLRNPSDKPQSIALDPGKVFQLPAGEAGKFSVRSPWKKDEGRKPVALTAGQAHVFKLKPFEVINLEAIPVE